MKEHKKEIKSNRYPYIDKFITSETIKGHHNEKTDCNYCKHNKKVRKLYINYTLTKKYQMKFIFYLAKPINEIIANVSQPHCFLYQDFLIYDKEVENLKNYYNYSSSKILFNEIISTSEKNTKNYFPNLSIVEQNKIIVKRYQKI